MVWATFGRGDASLQRVAVRVLGQIDDPSASRSLVMLAVFSGSPDVRRKAVETLKPRDAREFAGRLDRDDPADNQVRGEESRRSGPAGRAVDQGAGVDAQPEASLFTAGGPFDWCPARRSGRTRRERTAGDRPRYRNDDLDDDLSRNHGGGTTVLAVLYAERRRNALNCRRCSPTAGWEHRVRELARS